MTLPNRNIVMMQWVVIGVVVAGAAVAVIMLVNKTNDYQSQLNDQKGSMASLREQIRQAKNPAPSPLPALPEATANSATTPTPSATPKTPAR